MMFTKSNLLQLKDLAFKQKLNYEPTDSNENSQRTAQQSTWHDETRKIQEKKEEERSHFSSKQDAAKSDLLRLKDLAIQQKPNYKPTDSNENSQTTPKQSTQHDETRRIHREREKLRKRRTKWSARSERLFPAFDGWKKLQNFSSSSSSLSTLFPWLSMPCYILLARTRVLFFSIADSLKRALMARRELINVIYRQLNARNYGDG